MQSSRFLAMLSVAILIPIALGATYAVATSGDSEQAAVVVTESARATESMKAHVHAVTAAHKIARAKCDRLVGADRGNCRTEARAEAKRALKAVQEAEPRL